MERKICKVVRRSPRLVAKSNFMNSNYSTSMQDLNLAGASDTKGITSCTSDLGPLAGNIPSTLSKHEPKIRNLGKENNQLQPPSRALKRMRDSTLSLNNVMPTPVKRVKSCSDTTLPRQEASTDTKAYPIKKKFTKVISFARGLSPRRSRRKKVSEKVSMQRSTSLREPLVPPDPILNPKLQFPPVNNTRMRGSQRWVESLADIVEVDSWTPQQIKRQEAIHELYAGETDLIEDINVLQGVYFNPLSESKLVKGEDLSSIFETVQSLLPLHEDLVKKLEEVRAGNGSIDKVGEILLTWIPTLRPYIVYCAKQLEVKEILLNVSKDKQVSDFFQRCLEAPCSRKLDLWSFLDSPRTKLVKYPLLVSNIHKYTPKDHPDRTALEKSIKELELLIKEADTETGISKCNFYKEKLNFMEDEIYKVAFDRARMLICNGCLRNKSGSKCHAFLFDTIFILARTTTTKNGNKVYVVNTKPVLVADMRVFDLGDGEIRLGGSFRTTLSKGPTARHAFRVNNKWTECDGKSIILQANDQHDKKQWLNAFQTLLGESATKSYVIQ